MGWRDTQGMPGYALAVSDFAKAACPTQCSWN